MEKERIDIDPHDFVEVAVERKQFRYDGKVFNQGDAVVMKKYVADAQITAGHCKFVALRPDFDPDKPEPVDAVEVAEPPQTKKTPNGKS